MKVNPGLKLEIKTNKRIYKDPLQNKRVRMIHQRKNLTNVWIV